MPSSSDKKSKKEKKSKTKETPVEQPPVPVQTIASVTAPTTAVINEIARPLCGEKLEKKLLKIVKKCSKSDISKVEKGITRVTKALAKKKGLVVLAGDVDPVDVYSHLPCYCEEKKVPYVFVRSRHSLAESVMSKRSTSGILLEKPKDSELASEYEKILKKVISLK